MTDEMEIVPVTDQINARVEDAVEEVRKERAARGEPVTPRPIDEPPSLELAIDPSTIKAPHHEPLGGGFSFKRLLMKSMKLVIALVVLAAGAAAFLAFTETGRALLPREMRGQAKTVAKDVEERAKDATQDTFWTFTDEQGVPHIVDDLEKVPKELRSRAVKRH